MSADIQLAALGIEPTFSAREAAALLGRSYSWLDQRVRNGEFALPDVPSCTHCVRLAGTGISRSRCSKR